MHEFEGKRMNTYRRMSGQKLENKNNVIELVELQRKKQRK